MATSAGVIEPSISCLFAKTTRTAPPNSSSLKQTDYKMDIHAMYNFALTSTRHITVNYMTAMIGEMR